MIEDPDTMITLDDDGRPPNPPRLITRGELALLCKLQRRFRGWSQETLAELSGLQVRTIQRVENAEPSSPETRRALARAFGGEDIDVFNKAAVFPTAEDLEAKAAADKEAFNREYSRMAVVPATGLGLIRELNGCGAVAAEVVNDRLLRSRDAREEWGVFVDNLRDLADIAADISETDRLKAAGQLDEEIQTLRRIGIVVYVGVRRLASGTGERALRFRAVQIVGAPRDECISEIAVPRQVQIGY